LFPDPTVVGLIQYFAVYSIEMLLNTCSTSRNQACLHGQLALSRSLCYLSGRHLVTQKSFTPSARFAPCTCCLHFSLLLEAIYRYEYDHLLVWLLWALELPINNSLLLLPYLKFIRYWNTRKVRSNGSLCRIPPLFAPVYQSWVCSLMHIKLQGGSRCGFHGHC